MENRNIEYHPLPPFLPSTAKVLILGSFPPPMARWSMNFYYPNMQNDMWRIMGILFFDNKEYFVNRETKKFDEVSIRAFCTEKGISLSDTANAVVRLKANASDAFLKIVEPLNLQALLEQIPNCTTLLTTGQKASETLINMVGCPQTKIGSFVEFAYAGRSLRLYRMPSSSRAYPLAISKKAAFYGQMFEEIGISIKENILSDKPKE